MNERKNLDVLSIIREVGYNINGTEIGFFAVLLQKENDRIVPNYISIGGSGKEIKEAMAESLMRFSENIKGGEQK